MKKILLIFFILKVFSGSVYSQHNLMLDYKFRNITSKDGLSSNSVQSCFLDSYGFMWIGTQCGLNRYDAVSVKVFDHINSDSTSIGDGFIWSIWEDDEHFLWVGTNAGGLNKFDPKTEKFTRYKNIPGDLNSISNNTVNCIVEDNDKNLWLATMNGINRFDRKSGKFTRYQHSDTDSNTISYNGRSTLFKDRDGNIFAGTIFGLNKYIRSKDNFKRIHLTENDNFEILCISQDKSGIFWIGTQEKGIFKYNDLTGAIENIMPDNSKKNTLASNAIRAIVHCDNGLIWIGHLTERAGLDIYDTKTDTYYNFRHDKADDKSLALDVMWDIYKDRYNNMWVCTNGGGVSIYSEYAITFRHINRLWGDGYSRDLKVIWSVLYAYDRFWCYTEGMVLSFSKYGEFIKEYHPSRTGIRLFSPLRIGQTSRRFYAGDLDNSIACYEIEKDMFVKCPMKFKRTGLRYGVAFPYEDRDGNIWFGTNAYGLVKFDRDFNEVDIIKDSDSVKSRHFRKWSKSIYEDSGNNLWFGGEGISRFNLKSGELFNYKPNDKSPDSPAGDVLANYFYEDGKGNLWITYEGNGFDKLNMRNNTFKHYNVSNGLINNYLFCALPDNSGNLWFSSAKGLIKFNPETETYTNYDKSDGVQDEEFNSECYCRTEDGMLVFGGVNGINWFYPDSLKTNPHVPPIVLTSFKVFNKELTLPQNLNETEEIKLTYKENFFTIQFAALDFANPSKNQYKYMLEGIDKDWVSSGGRSEANYTDITPGDYVFTVTGSNNSGVWNSEGKRIRVIITPPWWQRWWFRGCAVLLIAGFIGYSINRRFNAIKKEKDLQQDFMRKLIDSQEQERKKLSAELHDSLGQDLVIIKNSAGMALNNFDKKENAEKLIKQISEISSSALHNVRTISHNLRPAELDRLGLTETINSIIEMVSVSSDIVIESDIVNIDKVFDKNNEVNFCRIIQECFNNIIKHSKATRASVQIKSEGSQVVTTIKDNGTGFDYYDMINRPGMKSFGLTGIYERVKMLDGTLKINSAPGLGTEIIIVNPITKNK